MGRAGSGCEKKGGRMLRRLEGVKISVGFWNKEVRLREEWEGC